MYTYNDTATKKRRPTKYSSYFGSAVTSSVICIEVKLGLYTSICSQSSLLKYNFVQLSLKV